VALTLRAVGGLTTREIADAFYVPEATMAQRISRAKRTLRGRRLDQPGDRPSTPTGRPSRVKGCPGSGCSPAKTLATGR
jgi:predicted RNA polymerase sigma factor